MSTHNASAKRRYGSGAIIEKSGTWYGKWRISGRQVMRRLGPVRTPGTRDGLTRTQAEAALRKAMADTSVVPASERVTVEEAGRALLAHLKAMGRKRSTMLSYESILRVHVVPYFGTRTLDAVKRRDIEAFMATSRARGQSVKSTLNYVGVLHSVFEHAQRREWVEAAFAPPSTNLSTNLSESPPN